MEVTDRPAGEFEDLERTLNALRIIGMDAGRRLRVNRCQPCMQRRPAGLPGLVLQSGTYRRIRRRHSRQPPLECPEIQQRATHQ